MDEYIKREEVIKNLLALTKFGTKRELVEVVEQSVVNQNGWLGGVAECIDEIEDMPSAKVVGETELIAWLLAYHTKLFALKSRYTPHEVIGWLINDITGNLLVEENDGRFN